MDGSLPAAPVPGAEPASSGPAAKVEPRASVDDGSDAPSEPSARAPARKQRAATGPGATANRTDPAAVDPPEEVDESRDTLEAEAALLLEARLALVERPHRALAMAEEHARRFPRPLLGDMREVIAIHALVRQDRRGDALLRGQAFLEARPLSAYADRVRRLIAPFVEDDPAHADEDARPRPEPRGVATPSGAEAPR